MSKAQIKNKSCHLKLALPMALSIFKEYVCTVDRHAAADRFCGQIFKFTEETLRTKINALHMVSIHRSTQNKHKSKIISSEEATVLPSCEVKSSSCVSRVIWYLTKSKHRELLSREQMSVRICTHS